MAWIEFHQRLLTDPEMLRVAAEMGWSDNECIGRLARFWWWCVDHCEDGDLRRCTDGVIAKVVALNHEEGRRFVDVMVGPNDSGFIERQPYFRLRNWWKFHGYRLQKKYARTPEKWQRIRDAYAVLPQRAQDNGIPARRDAAWEQMSSTNKNQQNNTHTRTAHGIPPPGAAGDGDEPDRCVCVLVDFYQAWLLEGFDTDDYTPSSADRKAASDVVAKLGARDHRPAIKRVVALMRQKFPAAKKFGASLPYWDEVLATLAKTEAVKQARQRTTEQTTQNSARAQAAATADSELIARYTAPFTNLDEAEQRRRVDEFAGSGVVPAAFSRRLAILKFAKERASDGQR